MASAIKSPALNPYDKMIRPYLINSYGVNDKDIGWKQNANGGGTVQIGGYDFMNITPEMIKDGRSYSTSGDLQKAIMDFSNKTGYDFKKYSNPASRNYEGVNTDKINSLMDEILSYPDFALDLNTDPIYKSLMETATKNGQKASDGVTAETYTLYGECGYFIYEEGGTYYNYFTGVSITSRAVDYIDVIIDVYRDGSLLLDDGAADSNAQTVACQSDTSLFLEGHEFYSMAIKILYKWLNRRSQRRSFTWDEFNAKMKWYGLIRPRIMEVRYEQVGLEDCFV